MGARGVQAVNPTVGIVIEAVGAVLDTHPRAGHAFPSAAYVPLGARIIVARKALFRRRLRVATSIEAATLFRARIPVVAVYVSPLAGPARRITVAPFAEA